MTKGDKKRCLAAEEIYSYPSWKRRNGGDEVSACNLKLQEGACKRSRPEEWIRWTGRYVCESVKRV